MPEIAEGKGPRQVKKPYILGQFVTIYGNDGAPGGLNPPAIPYTPLVGTGTGSLAGTTWNGGIPGGVAPGLQMNVNGGGSTAVGYVCSPAPYTNITDLASISALCSADNNVTWSGTANVYLQGTFNRLLNQTSYNGTNWVTVASGTITSNSGAPTALQVSFDTVTIYNAYRIVASGSTASGIINWSIPGLFIDLSAMSPTFPSHLAGNGSIGQHSLTDPRSVSVTPSTISGASGTTYPGNATYTNESISNAPYSATANDSDYIAP